MLLNIEKGKKLIPSFLGLMAAMGLLKCDSKNWRLFTDSAKRCLRCGLLHTDNKLVSLPIPHSIKVKEKHSTIPLVREEIKYAQHNWVVCVDLKIVNFLLGQQNGYMKYPCFIC